MTAPTSDEHESIRAKLPRAGDNGKVKPDPPSASEPVTPRAEPPVQRRRFHFLPAFWTIASVLSFTVNIVLIIILLLALQQLNQIRKLQSTATNLASGVLGGLYTNFVKMDQATISSTIPVDATIPLNIVVPVQTTTQIRLAESVTIPNAHVRINTGALSINSDAVVTLPADTPLTVKLDFPLTVQNSVPVHLDVPVNIPLNHTELHEPFVGLQKVVEPWYCLVEPNATVSGMQVCSPGDPTLTNPSLRNPTPVGTVIP